MKAIEQYIHVVLFIMLYKVVLTFKSVDEIVVWDHSNESYWELLLCDNVCARRKNKSYKMNTRGVKRLKDRESMLYKVVLTF